MLNPIEEKTILVKRDAEQKMFNTVLKLKEDIEELYEEMEILLNTDLVQGIEKSREEMKKGELYGWEKFKEIVDE